MIDLTEYTAAELAVIVRDATIAYERQTAIERAPETMRALADDYVDAVANQPPHPHDALPDALGPGERIVWTDGQTWRNTSGAFLPKTANPDTYPLGWTRLTLPDPDGLRRWALGESYEAGEYVYHEGVIASAVQAHRADDAAWAPGMAGTDALWKIHGTIEPEPEPEPDPEQDPDNPPAWDPTATYSSPPGATVTHKGTTYDLTFAVATPGQEPGDPTMWAIWKARTP